jgi:hypothetical protein
MYNDYSESAMESYYASTFKYSHGYDPLEGPWADDDDDYEEEEDEDG